MQGSALGARPCAKLKGYEALHWVQGPTLGTRVQDLAPGLRGVRGSRHTWLFFTNLVHERSESNMTLRLWTEIQIILINKNCFLKKSFGELVELAEKGDRRNVDLLVKDTAGSQYNKAPPEGMVSSFGKPAKDLFHETST